ncbi:MAG TPA: hypothetical protein DDY89_10290, partial [Lysinibacillus sp.]|nr:hypothetical protein [Lysinibacillus sp.]
VLSYDTSPAQLTMMTSKGKVEGMTDPFLQLLSTKKNGVHLVSIAEVILSLKIKEKMIGGR